MNIKKYLLGIIITFALAFLISPQDVFASGTPWKFIDQNNPVYVLQAQNEYYLNGDIKTENAIVCNVSVSAFHTSSHSINMTGQGSAIEVKSGSLPIDGDGTITITGDANPVIKVSGGTLQISDGVTIGCKSSGPDTALLAKSGSTVILEGNPVFYGKVTKETADNETGSLEISGGNFYGAVSGATKITGGIFYGDAINSIKSDNTAGNTVDTSCKTVTFNIADTTYAVEVVQSGSKVTVPVSTLDDGSNVSWCSDENCEQPYDFAKSTVSDNLTLYGKKISMISADSGAVKGESKSLGFTSNADYATFAYVVVDEHAITQGTDYTVKEGSTIVTLLPSYVASLSTGTHLIAIYSKINGENLGVSAYFTISEPSSSSSSSSEDENNSSSSEPVAETVAEPALDTVPKTGERDLSNAFLFFILSAACALTAVTVKRLRRH